jgi:hypothetical protein
MKQLKGNFELKIISGTVHINNHNINSTDSYDVYRPYTLNVMCKLCNTCLGVYNSVVYTYKYTYCQCFDIRWGMII